MIGYTDSPLIAAYLKRDLATEEEATLSVFLPAIKIWIDNKLSTTFELNPDATTRHYEGGDGSIDIEPCTEIESVTILQDDGTLSYAYSDVIHYNAYPLDDDIKTEIRLRYGVFPGGASRIAVKAKFTSNDGSGVPEDITLCATMIAADLLRLGAIDANAVEAESIEGHSVKYRNPADAISTIANSNPLVKSILDQRQEIMI